jgi:hypothetical protein
MIYTEPKMIQGTMVRGMYAGPMSVALKVDKGGDLTKHGAICQSIVPVCYLH